MKKVVVFLFIVLILAGAGMVLLINLPAAKYVHNMNLGGKYLLKNDYEGAIKAFTEAIDIEPDKAEAYLSRAEAYMENGQDYLAYQDYLQVERITGEEGLAEKETGIVSGEDNDEPEETETEEKNQEADLSVVDVLPTETPVPPEPTSVPDPEQADYDAFIQEVQAHPDMYFMEMEPGMGFYSYTNPGLVYSRGDIDTDGKDELFFSYTNHGAPYNVISTQVWQWNGSAFELYANMGGSYETMDFYTLGAIRQYPKNPKTLINPFTVAVYNSETKTYDDLFFVSGVDEYTIENYGVYDPSLDYDGDGIIYYKDNEETPLTQEEYEELIGPYVPDHAHLDLNWIDLI